MNDNAKHPDHYKLIIDGEEVESIDFIKAILGEEGFKKFCRGNALKYLIRADKKGGEEDLRKARVYINWEINDDYEAEQPELDKKHNQLEAAFNLIKANCKGYGNCDGCRFCEHGDCMLLAKEPDNWELPEETKEKYQTQVKKAVEQLPQVKKAMEQMLDTIKRLGQEEHKGEEEISPTQAKKAMEQLKAYCHKFNGCCEAYDGGEKCIFDEGEFCVLSEYAPVENWDLP